MLPKTSQLYVQIGRTILSNSLSNTLRSSDTTKESVYRSPSTVAEFLNVYLQILIVCYDSSQVWIWPINFKLFLCKTETVYLS